MQCSTGPSAGPTELIEVLDLARAGAAQVEVEKSRCVRRHPARAVVTAGSPPLVDISPMADLDDEDDELLVTDVVDDAEVAGPHPPLPGTSDQLPRPWRTRVFGQEVDGCLDPSAPWRVELAQLTDGGRR